MKFFAFIMAIVIMLVSLTPCKDGSASMKVEKSQSGFVQELHHDHDGGVDDCSPLCTCACCSAHSCPQQFFSAVGYTPENSIAHFSFYNGSLISISLPVWQPPQLLS